MNEDPLYQKIIDEFQPGDPPLSVKDAMERWGYGDSHTRSVMDWMADRQQPPVLRKLPGISPYKWERI